MSLLERIVGSTRSRVDRVKSDDIQEELRAQAAHIAPPRGFTAALQQHDMAIIAEIKRVSPLKGPLAPDLDALQTARAYEDGGAAALSVLTEPDFFRGSLDDLRAATQVGIPALRKDFIIDPVQVVEARAAGADAVLLIVRVVGDDLNDLLEETTAWGMDALVEVYDDKDVELALAVGASLIGINNRDLETFEVDNDRTAKLASSIPDDVLVAALSGVQTRAEVEALAAAGARAVLVGESLVTAADPVAKLRALRGSRS